MFKAPNKFRLRSGHPLASNDSIGNNGFFVIPHHTIPNYVFVCMQGEGAGWEHVSVSVAERNQAQTRCPTWEEMCWIKDQFWDEEDCIIQYHPSKSQYVNVHEFVLHLWRPNTPGVIIPIPDKRMVG